MPGGRRPEGSDAQEGLQGGLQVEQVLQEDLPQHNGEGFGAAGECEEVVGMRRRRIEARGSRAVQVPAELLSEGERGRGSLEKAAAIRSKGTAM